MSQTTHKIEVRLSAKDVNCTLTFDKILNSTQSLGQKLKSGLSFGVFSAIGQKAVSAVGNAVSSLSSELSDASASWQTFQANMEMNGHTAKEIATVKKELQDFATATIYSASDMSQTFAQLDAVTNMTTKETTSLVKGFGKLASAAEDPTQAMKTLSQQATQAAAKPTLQWMDFKLMLEQTPAGIAQVAKEMGKTTAELVADVQDGKIATQDFFDAVAAMDQNADLTKLSEQYKNVGQAMDGLSETATTKLQPAFDTLQSYAISSISGIIDKLGEIDADSLADKVAATAETAGKYWTIIKQEAGEVATAFGDAFSAINEDLSQLDGGFGSTENIKSFGTAVNTVGGYLVAFAGFLKNNSDKIAILIQNIPKLVIAFMTFKTIAAVSPIIMGVGTALGGLMQKLIGIGGASEKSTKSSTKFSKKWLQTIGTIVAVGAAVLMAGAGLNLMAQGAVALANGGAPAIACMVGMVAALAGLAYGAAAVAPALTAGAVGLVAFGAAVLLVGAGVAVASTGLALLAGKLPVISKYGTSSATAIAALGASMAILAAGVVTAGASCLVLSASMVALAASLVVGGAAAAVAGAGFVVLAAGVLATKVGLMAVNSSMKQIAKSAKSSATALTAMQSSVKVVSSGLDALKSKAKSAMDALTNNMKSAANNAKSSGTALGQNFANGMTSSLNSATSKAKTMSNSAAKALRGGYSTAHSAGAYISKGFALGMESCLGRIQKAAAKMVSAADKAVKAKAKIGSPSRVFKKEGAWSGKGYGLGLESMFKYIKNIAYDMVSIPAVESPQPAYAYAGGLSSDYTYGNSNIKIEVPLEMDGKQVAKATATYTQEELNKLETRENRKKGLR